ncbi:MAG: MFS transporter [Planctomycetota bacterium]|jgi:MFS family permease
MPSSVHSETGGDHAREAFASRWVVILGSILLFASALPDAMVVPVLKQLLMDRYDISPSAAHLFMSVNILGAFLAAGTIIRWTRRVPIAHALCVASLMNAALLALMALPIGFVATLVVRTIEGAADITVYALLFHVLSRTGGSTAQGRRMGMAATCMMLGIAGGIALGGVIGGTDAIMTLWAGSIVCLCVAGGAWFGLRRDSHRGGSALMDVSRTMGSNIRQLWPALVMMFGDRVVGGLLAITVPLYLASAMEYDPPMVGRMIGVAMLGLALGACPAGRVVDRIGVLRTRLLAGGIYAGGFALIPVSVASGSSMAWVVFLCTGLGGAALFASSLVLVCQRSSDSSAMGAYHAAGNLGFFVGPLVAATLLRGFGGTTPDARAFAYVLVGFAILHVVLGGIGLLGALRRTPGEAADMGRATQLA